MWSAGHGATAAACLSQAVLPRVDTVTHAYSHSNAKEAGCNMCTQGASGRMLLSSGLLQLLQSGSWQSMIGEEGLSSSSPIMQVGAMTPMTVT
jgi:hypothetical protein